MAFIKENPKKEAKTQDQWIMKESALCEPVKHWLIDQGFDFFSEVPHPTSFSFIDVVGKRGAELMCIELKASLSDKAIRQAYYSRMITPKAYVAVGSKPKQSSIDKCLKYGIGILSIKNNQVSVILEPSNKIETFPPYIKSILDTLSNGGFNGVAGLPNMKGSGPAQKVLELVEEALLKNPKISWKELFDTIPNHYSNHASMRQGINKARERKK